MLASVWILPGILILSTLQGLFGDDTSFQQMAIDTFNLVEEKLHVENCTKSAREKAAKLTKKTTGDEYYAAAWISMYSRLCLIDETLLIQNKDINNFPFRLNKEVRCLQNKERDSSLSDVFVKVRNIIDDSLNILSMENQHNLLRGMTTWNYYNQTQFVDEAFFSTTSDITPALRFAKGKVLLIVKQMNGVAIAKYVEDRFRCQKEVLGRSGKMFKIEKYVRNNTEIEQIVSEFKPKWDKLTSIGYPEVIIYATEDMSGQDRSSVIDKQRQTMTSYCSIQDEPRFEASIFPGLIDCNEASTATVLFGGTVTFIITAMNFILT